MPTLAILPSPLPDGALLSQRSNELEVLLLAIAKDCALEIAVGCVGPDVRRGHPPPDRVIVVGPGNVQGQHTEPVDVWEIQPRKAGANLVLLSLFPQRWRRRARGASCNAL